MSYLLYVSVSPQGERSVSRNLANDFLSEYLVKHPGTTVVERDLTISPIPHLDGETLGASWSPVETHSPAMAEKFKYRMELINEFKGAAEILVSTPMWNWNVPSVLKAYIDQLIHPGVLGGGTPQDSISAKVTVIAAQGGSYAQGTPKEGWDWFSGYVTQVFTQLGSSDVKVILSELNYAGMIPGMESLVNKKEASFTEAKNAVKARV
jgi:FMN-dependent NADH-azoreductase